jgi:hypothetical protein
MNTPLDQLRDKVARKIEELKRSLCPVRDYAFHAATNEPNDLDSALALAALGQEVNAWKCLSARLATIVPYEPHEHRAVRLPPRR